MELSLLLNFHSQRKFQESLKEIKRLQKQFPASPILYNIHGVMIAGLGDYQQAINTLTGLKNLLETSPTVDNSKFLAYTKRLDTIRNQTFKQSYWHTI